jgi:hypothetical protein
MFRGQSALLSYLFCWIQFMFYVGLIMCMDVTMYVCNRGILEILIFLFFNSTLVTGKDCCPLPISWLRSLVPTDW